jgi:hypothetical protein
MGALPDRLSGEFWILFLYDVCEEIRLEDLRAILGARPAGRAPRFRRPTPEYVRFEKPPVIEYLEPLVLESGERLQHQVHYYEYGVVSIELQLPFEFGWDELIHLSSRWIAAPDIEKQAADSVRRSLVRARPALVKPYENWLSEDYYIIQLRPVVRIDGSAVTGEELIAGRGDQIAQIVRGETMRLAADERNEILQSHHSYYPDDLVVIGWTAALVYDTPEDALPVIQLLEYANSQLLEFRYYDEMLTRLLADVYRSLDKGTGALARWRLAREAQRLNTIRLDVRELRHGLPRTGGRQTPHGRGVIPVHGGPVPTGARLRAGVAGGDYSGDRAGVFLSGEDVARSVTSSSLNSTNVNVSGICES